MEEKTGKEIKFDINIEKLDIKEDIIKEGSRIFPIKGKIVLEGKIKYHKKFISILRILKIIQKLKRSKKIKKVIRKKW